MATGHEAIIDDGVLVVAIDHPPVNAIATPVRQLLFGALQRAVRDPQVRAVVVTGNDRVFSAGADLGEFAAGTAMDPPSLHGDILPLVASMTKPVVAAVRGVALGGGLELALGCHDRIFVEGTRIGLPETTLGLMPGAGGTQALPRAIGLERATDLIVTGRIEPVERFAVPAFAHAIVPTERLIETATRRASGLADCATPFRAIGDTPIDDDAGTHSLHERIARSAARGDTLPGVLRALEAIALTTSKTIADGMRAEFALFEPLLDGLESRALRHVFLAERRRKADAGVVRFERAAADRIDARLAREGAALARAGVDGQEIARVMAAWRSAAPWSTQGPDDVSTVATWLLGAIIDEGHELLAADGQASEADLDLALVRSGLFARVRGGPFFLARVRKVERVPEAR